MATAQLKLKEKPSMKLALTPVRIIFKIPSDPGISWDFP